MKKIYSKVLVSAFVAASSFFGAQAEEVVVLQENFNKLEVLTEAGIHKYGKNPWTKTDAEGVEYQPNYTNIQTDGNVADLNEFSHFLLVCLPRFRSHFKDQQWWRPHFS